MPVALRRVFDANRHALRSYVATPYPGRITLFRASEGVLAHSDRSLGWTGHAAQGIDIQPQVMTNGAGALIEGPDAVLGRCRNGEHIAAGCRSVTGRIHGGNGYAMEYQISRVLCDARILNIFEGAAEIQAQVIARRLLEGGN